MSVTWKKWLAGVGVFLGIWLFASALITNFVYESIKGGGRTLTGSLLSQLAK